MVRHLFALEPLEVSAVGTKTPGRNYNFDDSVAVTLRFPGERIAQFFVTYASAVFNQFSVVGTKGSVASSPCYFFGPDVAIEYDLTVEGEKRHHNPGPVEQFGGETDYFSDCILNNRDHEADGTEGLRDVRVLAAIERALETS
nr:Gfo/Idh/MocA family oxidoreductase [Phytohalomonas tamaricis]